MKRMLTYHGFSQCGCIFFVFSRSNYYALSELLRLRKCTRGQFLLEYPADVKTTDKETLMVEAEGNWVRL